MTDARRSGALGVHSLDHFALSVPDLEVAANFYDAFGLDVRRAATGLDLHTHGHSHRWAHIAPGDDKALRYIAFGAFDDDLASFALHLADQGIKMEPAPAGLEGGLWLRDPHGVLLQILGAAKTSPDAKAVPSPASPAGLRSAPMRGETAPIHPRRLSHALFFTPDIDASIAFYTRVLGLKVSDHPGPVAFLHGPHGSEHHLIAFAQSDAPGYHHSAWDVGSIEEVGLGAAQMAEAGYRQGWGLGRHVLGSNYFHYVRDPWGSFAEYSFGIDYIPVTLDWPVGRPDPENSLYLWGPPPPEDFIINHEAKVR